MKWIKDANKIPAKTEVLVVTDIGERLIAWRNRKNGKYLDVKAPTAMGKIEWLKNHINLNGKLFGIPYCPVVYWSRINDLPKER